MLAKQKMTHFAHLTSYPTTVYGRYCSAKARCARIESKTISVVVVVVVVVVVIVSINP
jgi:hypothetical protein